MLHRLLRVLFVAVVGVLIGTAPASAAVSRTAAGQRALSALGVKKGKAPVVVFRVSASLPGGTVLTQAGDARPPKPSGKLDTSTKTAGVLLRVPSGHRAWAFYADWAPYQAYAHRGQLAIVDAATGSVRLSRFMTSPPVIDGRLPEFMRSGRAYRSPNRRIFERTYVVSDSAALQLAGRTGFGYRLDRAPLPDLSLAQQAADQLAADHACALRISDTYGEFYDFTGADNTRARLGDLFYVLRQLNPAIVDERYSRTSKVSPIEALRQLITDRGCKDVFLYVAGRGFSSGPGTSVSVGTRVRGGRVLQQLVQAGDLDRLIGDFPGVTFSIKVDAPYTKPFIALLAKRSNVLLAETAAGSDGTSFGYLPYVTTKAGKRITNASNPDGLLAFTNRTIQGIERFLTSLTEVDAALAARRAGQTRSFLATMLGRAFSLGLSDDLPTIVGIQQPFFSQTTSTPNGPPATPPGQANTPKPPVNHAPLVTPSTVTTPEDTPITLGVGAADPDGDGLTLTIVSGPSHGTAVVTGGLQVTYTPDPNYNGPDSFTFKVGDGKGASAGSTVSIDVTPVNDAPVVVASAGSAQFTEGGPAATVDPGVQVSDIDDATLAGATATITAGRSSDDILAFTAQAGITGSYDAASGVLTLSGTASVADYQSALRSITFRISGANPAAGTRTVSLRVADAAGPGVPDKRDVTVVTVNDAPTLTNGSPTLAYTENDTATAIDSTIAITDPDSPQMSSATVAIAGGLQSAEDRLRFTDQAGISGSYNAATGVLTLTGTAPRGDYETALRSVAYENLSDAPTTAARTIAYSVNDGAATSTLVTATVTVTAVNDAPTVTTTAGTATFTEQGSAVVIDPTVSVADADSASLSGATVEVAANFAAGDLIGFTNQAGITGSYNAATGVLTLTGTATLAAYQTALRSIVFSTPSSDPSTATRTISFKVSDTAPATSTAATRDVAVVAVNDAPVLAAAPASITYTEDASPVAIAPAITASDVDDANLEGATVGITAGKQPGDSLQFTDQNGITGTYTAATGTLTLTGSASKADYQAALRSITFSSTEQGAAAPNRTISLTVTDGDVASNIVTIAAAVAAVNDAPSVATSAGTAAFTEGAAAVAVDPALTLADVDSTTLSGATVAVTANDSADDVLAFTPQAGITGAYNAATRTLTLTGSATLAEYQAALRSVTFAVTGDDPSPATRTVRFVVSDGAPLASAPATRDVTVTPVNDAPVLAGVLGGASYTEGGSAVLVASAITTADPDSANLSGATVAITANFAAGDALGFTDQNGITGSYAAATGILTLTGSASKADYQTALRSITFSTPSDDPSTAARTVSLTVSDGALSSNTVTSTVTVAAVNDAPTITTTTGSTSYTEGDSPVVVDGGLAIADPDSTSMASATVTVGGFAAGDQLAVGPLPGGVTSSYAGGVLTITGSATVAEYQALLRTVTYASTSTSQPTGTRTIGFAVRDSALALSSTADKTIDYTAVNSAPVVTASAGSTAVSEGSAGAAIDSALTVVDSDDASLASAQVAITTGFTTGDELAFTNQNGIVGAYNSATGVLNLVGISSVANYQTALRSVKFVNAGPVAASGARTITLTAVDSSNDAGQDTKAIAFTATDDPPSIATSAGSTAYTENDPLTTVDAGLTLSDPDSAALASAEVSITNAQFGDRLAVAAGYSVPGSLTVTGGNTATITITGAATPTEYRDLLRAIGFENTTDSPGSTTRTVRFKAADATTTVTAATDKSIAVTPVNDPPVGVTDAFTTDEDTVKLGDVRANDVDADDATNTLVVDQVAGASGNVGTPVTLASGAKVTIDASGNLSYDPRGAFDSLQSGQSASDSVTYRVKDPSGATSSAVTVNFTINGVNDAPQAVARTYNAIANVPLELEKSGAGGISAIKERIDGDLLVGASDPDDPAADATLTDQTIATSGGGTVDIDPDGTFVYTSEAGETAATDSFQFQIKDTHGATSSQTVSLDLKQRVFFVDADNAGAATGTAQQPFTTVTAATAAAGTGETVYVSESTPQAASAATMKTGQSIIGSGSALTVDLGGSGTPSGVVTLRAAGTRPVLAASSGAGITVANNATISGLDIDPSGSAKGITGTGTGLSVGDVSVNDQGTASTGAGIDLSGSTGTFSNVDVTTQSAAGIKLASSSVSVSGGSDISATGGPAVDSSSATGGSLAFGNVSSTNSTGTGISLSGAASFSATAGSISGSAGVGLDVGSGAATITYPGSISPAAAATAVRVQSRSGGTVTASGALTTSGNASGVVASNNTGGTITLGGNKSLTSTASPAVNLSSNTGATVQFTGGGLVASSTGNDAFRATGGGTVTVSGSGNSLAAGSSGAALIAQNTNLNGMTFQSVSDTGGAQGIVLENTGSGSALTVTGDSGTTRNTSGGTIASTTGADGAAAGNGIYLSNTGPVNLEQMRVTGVQNNGILASAVNGLSFSHGTVDTSGNNEAGPYLESNIRLTAMTGAVVLDDDAISTPQSNNVYMTHNSGSASLSVTGSALTMDPTRTGVQNDGVLVDGGDGGSLTATITGNTFSGAAGDHVQIAPGGGATANAAWTATVSNNQMISSEGGSGDDLGGGLTITPAAFNGTLRYTLNANTIRGANQGAAINANQGSGTSVVNGTITGNTIGIAGDEQSASFQGSGIVVDAGGTGSHTVLVQGNNVQGNSEVGIIVEGAIAGTTATAILNATVKNNTIGTPWTTGSMSLYGLYVNVGIQTAQTGTNCVDVQNNTFSGSAAGYVDLRMRKRASVTVQLPGYTGAATDGTAVGSYLTGRNALGSAGLSVTASGAAGGYTNTPGGAACPQPLP